MVLFDLPHCGSNNVFLIQKNEYISVINIFFDIK